jgi:hypothetical protein
MEERFFHITGADLRRLAFRSAGDDNLLNSFNEKRE